MDINVNYHSSIRIGNVYIDPFKIKEQRNDARYIFITHSHYDHYSPLDIAKVVNAKTIFVCTKDVEEEIKKEYSNEILVVGPNLNYSFGDISFKTFSSFNIDKKYHPLENGWVGYVVEIEGVKYAVLGDSDLTDDVKNIRCDVLFVPIGGVYTMTAREAGELTNIINPKLVIPVHYNGIVGTKDDEKEFLKELNDCIKYKLYV
jgi:L-ascorbate metabolism protein UlaG (beta-lactamase superfamily)